MRIRISSHLGTILLAIVLLATAPVLAKDEAGKEGPVTLDLIKQIEDKVEAIVEKVMPATVCVRSANGRGSGSGVIVNEEGLVLTAAHVTMAAGKDLVIVFPDGREMKAESLGANQTRDAGMARIVAKGKYPFAEVGKSKGLTPNQWCVALGHAGGFDPRRTPPVRLGRVLNNGRFVTTDCTLIGGDSGGPLFDLEGRVIGIHSNIGASLSQNNHVPVDAYHDDWDRMRKGETWGQLPRNRNNENPNRPVLGIQLALQSAPGGAGVDSVMPASPAEKAGLKAGDVIKKVDGKSVDGPQDVIKLVGAKKVNQEVALQVLRGEETLELKAKLVRARDLQQPNRRPPSDDDASKDDASDDDDSMDADADPPADAPKKDEPKKDEPKKDEPKKDEPKKDEPKKDEPKKDGDKSKGDKQADKAKPERLDLDKLLRRARQNGGRLQLTPEQFKQFQKQMGERLRREAQARGVANDQWSKRIFNAYKSIVTPASKSVHRVFVGKKQVALATVVDAEGRLLTKLSEIADKEFEVDIAKGKRVAGKIVKKFDDYDLALVKVDSDALIPVKLSAPEEVELGTFIAAVTRADVPAAIGVVSVLERGLDAKSQGFLGVNLEQSDNGVKLSHVHKGSPAEKGGLKTNDLVLSVEGKELKAPAHLAKSIAGRDPGETISMKVKRGDEELELKVKLGDRRSLASMPGRQTMMNRMGGALSQRRTGFKLAVQHDCPLRPQDCGGPLIDLEGRLVGINIARAGRIKSFAIPAEVVAQLVESN